MLRNPVSYSSISASSDLWYVVRGLRQPVMRWIWHELESHGETLQVLFIGLVLLTPGNAGSCAGAIAGKCQTWYSGTRTLENTHKSLSQKFWNFHDFIQMILANFYLDVGSAIKISQFLSRLSTGLIKLSKTSIFLPFLLSWAIKWCCIENGR